MAFVVGLTGGIASGKTTVADLFQQHFAIDVVDADLIARDVVAPGSDGLEQIHQHFGPEILHVDGALNRALLREIIFADPAQKTWLNQLLHPMIRNEMIAAVRDAHSPYVLLVVPLLVENQLQSLCDRILVVDIDEALQIKRTMERDNVSESQAKAILASQASRSERLAHATEVIKNQTNKVNLLHKITQLHAKYLALSNQDGSK